MKKPQDFSNLFLDMNAFFASVEQQVQPQLRGKPVGVAPYIGDTGCVIAKSYEAKKFGVGTGNSVGEAKKLCPQIIILESRPELYMFYHRQIVQVLESFVPAFEVLSVDEFNLSLRGLDQKRENALKMARDIKQAICQKVGDYLSCSVGIAANKWLAKVAGESKKPDGLVILTLEELPALYRTLSLTDLPGINFRLERQFRRRKIKTPFDLFCASLLNLSRWFGHPGRLWFYRLRGYEVDERASAAVKSIGHSHVLAPEFRTIKRSRDVLAKLSAKCARRLREKKMTADEISVSISFLGHGGYWHKDALLGYNSDTLTIQNAALKLYDGCRVPQRPLRLSVTLYNLKPNFHQMPLFGLYEKRVRLAETIDILNDKFGDGTIIYGSSNNTDTAAPNRIPFGDPGRLEF